MLLRNPTTGIAACCARAARGHVTAGPPTAKMNSRARVYFAYWQRSSELAACGASAAAIDAGDRRLDSEKYRKFKIGA
jgi:hypothetical protein